MFGLFPFNPVARFGMHQFVSGGLSLGGGIIYSYEKLDISPLGSLGGSTTFGFAPRVGYAIPFGPTTALWLRAGFSYTHSSDASDDGSSWQFSPGGEVYLVITPVPHFGITLGPYGEFAVAGKQTSCASSNGSGQGCTDTTYLTRYFGLTFGVLADF